MGSCFTIIYFLLTGPRTPKRGPNTTIMAGQNGLPFSLGGIMTALLPYLQTFLAIGNLCIMLWALKTFLSKPQATLSEQVKTLEKRMDAQDIVIKDITKSLDSSHEKHREQKSTNEVFITSMLAFIDFEIAFCQHTGYEYTDDLLKAKETLQKHLATR